MSTEIAEGGDLTATEIPELGSTVWRESRSKWTENDEASAERDEDGHFKPTEMAESGAFKWSKRTEDRINKVKAPTHVLLRSLWSNRTGVVLWN